MYNYQIKSVVYIFEFDVVYKYSSECMRAYVLLVYVVVV
jgi:hypothetical protein